MKEGFYKNVCSHQEESGVLEKNTKKSQEKQWIPISYSPCHGPATICVAGTSASGDDEEGVMVARSTRPTPPGQAPPGDARGGGRSSAGAPAARRRRRHDAVLHRIADSGGASGPL